MYVSVAAMLGVANKVPGGWGCVAAVEVLLVVQIVAQIAVLVVWASLLQAVKGDYNHISSVTGGSFPNRKPFIQDDADDVGTDDFYAGWYGGPGQSSNDDHVNSRFRWSSIAQGLSMGFPEVGAVGSGIGLFTAGLLLAAASLIAGGVAAVRGDLYSNQNMNAPTAHKNTPLTQVTEGIYEE
jgi:hypothetical protein